ncbi:MAG: hypothetical protein GX832_06150, partial [Clostridiales bacterium]|nr:hypothetical protein [Clostridiales bacterium]
NILGRLRSSANKFIESGKFGTSTSISFAINSLPDMGMAGQEAAILDVLKNIRATLDTQFSLDGESPQFSYNIGLSGKDTKENAATMNIYNVGNDIVVSVPELFDKPLVLKQDALSELLADEMGSDVPTDLLFNLLGSSQNLLDLFSEEKLDKMISDLRDIYYKYTGEPTLVKDYSLTVGDVTEKVDYFEAVIPADKFGDFAKEILTYIRDHEDIKTFLDDIGKSFPAEAMGNPVEQFQAALDQAMAQIDNNPDNFKAEVKRILYVDADNNPRGGTVTLINKADNANGEEVTLESVTARDGDKGSYRLRLAGVNFGYSSGDALNFTADYTEKDDLATGSYKLLAPNVEISGTYTDLGLYTDDDTFYPVGEFRVDLANMPLPGLNGGEIVYNGEMEKDHLIATISVKGDVEGSPLDVGLEFDLYQMKESNIKFENSLPADYTDITDEAALESLMNDPSLMMKAMAILNKLGINVADFMN